MALRSVIDINVDTRQFDAFVAKFQAFQQSANVNVGVTGVPGTPGGGGSVPGTTQPGSARPTVTPATTPGGGGAAPAAPGTTQPGSMGPTVKPLYGPPPPPPKPQFGPPPRVPIVPNVAPNPWLPKPPPPPTAWADAMDRMGKASKEVAKNFSTMREHTTGVLKNIREMASRLLSISGSLALLTGAATGFGFLGFNALAQQAGNRRQQAMALGTTPGGQFATTTHLGRFGIGTQTLSELGRAAQDFTSEGHRGLQAALGRPITGTEDRAQLLRDLLQSPMVRDILQERDPSRQQARIGALGLGSIITPEILSSLNRAAPGEVNEQINKAAATQQREDKEGPTDAQLRGFQDFMEKMDLAGRKIWDIFVVRLTPLQEPLIKLTTAFGNVLDAFLKSDTLKGWIEGLATAIEGWAKTINENPQAIQNFVTEVGKAATALGGLVIALGKAVLWVAEHMPSKSAVAGGAAGLIIGARVGGVKGALLGAILGAAVGGDLTKSDEDKRSEADQRLNPNFFPGFKTPEPLKRFDLGVSVPDLQKGPAELISDALERLLRRMFRGGEAPKPPASTSTTPTPPAVPAPAPPVPGDPWQLRKPAAYQQPLPVGRSPFVQPAAYQPPAANDNPVQRAAAFRQQVDNPIQQATFRQPVGDNPFQPAAARTVGPAPATPAATGAPAAPGAPMAQDTTPRPTGASGGAPPAPQGTSQGPWDKPIPVLPWPLPLPVTLMDTGKDETGGGGGGGGGGGAFKVGWRANMGGSQGGEGAGGGQDGGTGGGGTGGGGGGTGGGGGGGQGGGGGGGDTEGGRPGDFGGVADPKPGQAMAPAALRDMISSRLNIPGAQAAAIVSNFQAESGLKADLNEKNPLVKGSRGGYGLAQWTADRRRDLEGWAQKQGLDVRQHSTQVGFMAHELDTKFPGWRKKLNAAGNDPQEIAKVFFRLYESGGAASLEQHLGKHVRGARGVAALPPSTKEAVTNEANRIGRQDAKPPQRPGVTPPAAPQPAAPQAGSPIQQATINLRLDNQTGSNAVVSGGQLAA